MGTTVRWWAVLAFGAALSAGAWGEDTTGDPPPGTETPGDPPSCTYAKLSEKDATDKTEFEGPEADALKKTQKACAVEAEKTFEEVREAIVIPDGDESAYGTFHSRYIEPLETEGGRVKKAMARKDGVGKCPDCGKTTLYTFEGYPGYSVKKADWGGKTSVEMAYWTEYRENANTAINPEARIAWEIHYKAVLDHENIHKSDYDEYIKAWNAAATKYSAKVMVMEVCAKDINGALKKARDSIRARIEEKYDVLRDEISAAEKAFKEAADKLDEKDLGAFEKLVPGAIPLVATAPQIDPVALAAKQWEVDFDATGQITARTGFSYYNDRPSFSMKWSLAGDDLPTWLAIDEDTGKITAAPKRDNIAQYKEGQSYEATVKVVQSHTGYLYQPSMAAERKIAFTVKSWIPVIEAEIDAELAPNEQGEARYTVQDGTGVPAAKNPTWRWSRTLHNISISTGTGGNTDTYVLKSSAENNIYTLNGGNRTITVNLRQTTGGVAFVAESNTANFRRKKIEQTP